MSGWEPVTSSAVAVAPKPAADGWAPVATAPVATATAAPAQPAAPQGEGEWAPVGAPVAKPLAAPATPKPDPTIGLEHIKSKYAQDLDAAAAKYKLDPHLLRAVHFVEDSSEDPNVISSAGAIGEMQMKPGTFKQFAGKGASITDATANIDAGAAALSYYMKKYGGDVNKALVAYNQGESYADKGGHDVDDYAKNVQGLYRRLVSGDTGPGHPNAVLPKGGFAAVIGATPAPVVAHGSIGPIAGGAVGYAAAGANKFLHDQTQNLKGVLNLDHLTDDQRAALQRIGQSDAMHVAATGGRIVADLVMLPFSSLNAMMLDVANGNTQRIGDVGQKVFKMLGDPGHAGDFLDALTEKYGPFTQQTNAAWASLPGVRERMAKANPKTMEGKALQQALGLQADVGRLLYNNEYISGALAAVTGLYAPVGPEMALVRGAGRIGGKLIDNVATSELHAIAQFSPNTAIKIAATHDVVTAATEKFLASAPIIGDRYRPVWKQFGEIGEHHQRVYVKNQAEAAYDSQQALNQENKMGGTTREQAVAIHREADRFFNPNTTLHVLQPGGGDPVFDALTGVTVMSKGPAYGMQVAKREVVYAQHPAPIMPKEPSSTPRVKAGKETDWLFGTQGGQTAATMQAKNFKGYLSKSRPSRALQMVGIAPADADAFEQSVLTQAQSIKGKVAQRQFVAEQTLRKALGAQAKIRGVDAVEREGPHGTQVIVPNPLKAMDRDETMIGNVSTHDRAVNTMHVMKNADDISKAVAPSVADRMIEGYAPRGGMFANESTLLERLEGQGEGLKSGGGTGGPVPGQTQKREYGSIDHALANGEQINPTFDPRAAFQGSLTRSLRFQTYMRYVMNRAQEVTEKSPTHAPGAPSAFKEKGVDKGLINYDEALRRALETGRLDPLTAPAPGSLDPLTGTATPKLTLGPAGRKSLDDWVRSEAAQRLATGPNKMTPQQLAATPDGKMPQIMDAEMSKIHDAIQAQFEADYPNLIYRADQQLGVDDLAGLTVPKVIRDAAIDGHPVLAQQAGMAPTGAWALKDTPENWILNGLETTSNLLRTVFMTNILYHPLKNIARLAFGFGHLNPVEIMQGLLAPHTIDDAILREAEQEGALQRKFMVGPAGRKTQARYAYANAQTYDRSPKGIVEERGAPLGGALVTPKVMDLPRRVKTMVDGYRNVIEDGSKAGGVGVGMHILGKASYNADKWNTEWTFGVWEDALAAMTYRKLRDIGTRDGKKIGEAKAHAANETRRIMGDTGNLTRFEQQAGLARLNWFYGWTKGQWRLWSRIMTNPRAAQFFTMQEYGLRAANENSGVPNPEDFPEDLVWGYGGDGSQKVLRVGGGYLTKAEGIASLATAPLTGGQGLLDFADAADNDFFNTLMPLARMILVNAGQTFGYPKGQEPSPWGAMMDRDLPIEEQGKQMAKSIGARVQPMEKRSIEQTIRERDPIYLMDLLGIPAKNLADVQEARVHGIIESNVRKKLDAALRLSRTDQEREALKQTYGPAIEQEEDARAKLLGY